MYIYIKIYRGGLIAYFLPMNIFKGPIQKEVCMRGKPPVELRGGTSFRGYGA